MTTATPAKPKTVEVLKHCEQGIRIRIYNDLYRFNEETGQYSKAINGQWATYTPTDRIKQIIDDTFEERCRAIRRKAYAAEKHAEQMAFLDANPGYMNKKARQKAMGFQHGWRNH